MANPVPAPPVVLFEADVPEVCHEFRHYARVRVCRYGEWVVGEALNHDAYWEISGFSSNASTRVLLHALAAKDAEIKRLNDRLKDLEAERHESM